MKAEWTNRDSLSIESTSQNSKAILVIDIDANKLPKDAYGNIYVFGKYYEEQENHFIGFIGNVPLKPIPNEACEMLVQGLDAMEKMKSVEVRVVRRTE